MSSLMFVAGAYTNNGDRYLDPDTNEWVMDLFTYDLVGAHNDVIDGQDGDDVLIGQRGNDNLVTGQGNDLAVGDAGSMKVGTNLDWPRIYQVFRSMETGDDSYYAPEATDLGFVFMNDFELFPAPHRIVDSQASIIDQLLTLDDASSSSHLVRDVFGISGSIETMDGSYCMHPIFRIVPGYVSKTDMLHGDDTILSNGGADFLIGDDLRGFSALDLTQFGAIRDAREEIDALVNDLSIRLSTLGYDTLHRAAQNATEPLDVKMGFDLSVGCDNITTSGTSTAFVTGDTLNFLGRTFLGSYLDNPVEQIPQALERMQDIHHALVLLHVSLYEIHLDLLKRSIDYDKEDIPSNPLRQRSFENQNNGEFKLLNDATHRLKMANDIITLFGNDTAVGDSATLYIQVDSTHDGFQFEEIGEDVALGLVSELASVAKRRQDELDVQVKEQLDISLRLSDELIASLLFADVPFYLYVGCDEFDLYNQATAVGDFATLGVLFSDDPDPTSLPCPGNCLHPFIGSIENLRKKPSLNSFLPRLRVYETDFFAMRFDEAAAQKFEPVYHGDVFTARSSNCLVLGDYLDAATFKFVKENGGVAAIYVHGEGSYDNYEWVTEPLVTLSASAYYEGKKLPWSADTLIVVGDAQPYWQDQKTDDGIVLGGSVRDVDFADDSVESAITKLFFDQDVAEQLTSDTYRFAIPYKTSRDISTGSLCSDGGAFGFTFPFHTRTPNLRVIGPETPPFFSDVLSPSPTVTAMPSVHLDMVWYPHFEESHCRDDGNEEVYMIVRPEWYLFTSAEDCCQTYFQWDLQGCREKVSTLSAFPTCRALFSFTCMHLIVLLRSSHSEGQNGTLRLSSALVPGVLTMDSSPSF